MTPTCAAWCCVMAVSCSSCCVTAPNSLPTCMPCAPRLRSRGPGSRTASTKADPESANTHLLEAQPMAALHLRLRHALPDLPREHVFFHGSHYALSLIDVSRLWNGPDGTPQLSFIASNYGPLREVSAVGAKDLPVGGDRRIPAHYTSRYGETDALPVTQVPPVWPRAWLVAARILLIPIVAVAWLIAWLEEKLSPHRPDASGVRRKATPRLQMDSRPPRKR